MEEFEAKYYKDKNNNPHVVLSENTFVDESMELVEITKKEYDAIVEDNAKKIEEVKQAEAIKQTRIQDLQDKAIIEGLTDAEKEEYKKLKGVK